MNKVQYDCNLSVKFKRCDLSHSRILLLESCYLLLFIFHLGCSKSYGLIKSSIILNPWMSMNLSLISFQFHPIILSLLYIQNMNLQANFKFPKKNLLTKQLVSIQIKDFCKCIDFLVYHQGAFKYYIIQFSQVLTPSPPPPHHQHHRRP